jgi:4-diphosphocytidyl-2-C-methyl-D-erythritol kinase
MLTVLAPAKVNLTLEVLAARPDGFHEIRSIAQTIDLCDELHFQAGDRVEFRCTDPNWLAKESLAKKAADLLRARAGCARGVTVTLDKRIPLLSGLGGDSSDAAAVLRGLNQFWGLDLAQEELSGLASQLGSDVAFFLHGGTALLQGRGEVVTPLAPLSRMWLVLMLPPVAKTPGKTGRLYASITSEHYTDGEASMRMADEITRGGRVTANMVFNVFDRVAPNCFEGLSGYRERFLACGAPEVHLAGSGPALFTLTRDKAQAERIHHSLRQQELKAYLARTLAAVDYIS